MTEAVEPPQCQGCVCPVPRTWAHGDSFALGSPGPPGRPCRSHCLKDSRKRPGMGVAILPKREAPAKLGHQGGDCVPTWQKERRIQFRPVCVPRGNVETLPVALGRSQPPAGSGPSRGPLPVLPSFP